MDWLQKWRRALIIVLTVLTVGVLVPILCITLLVPSVTQDDDSSRTDGLEGYLSPTEVLNPEIATKYGIRGYFEVTFVDLPQEIAISRGGEWQGTIEGRFVSYTSELSEIEVHMDPNDPEGTEMVWGGIDVSSLISYEPSGVIKIKADESLLVRVTVSIPVDLPQNIDYIPLIPVGINAYPKKGMPCVFTNTAEIFIS